MSEEQIKSTEQDVTRSNTNIESEKPSDSAIASDVNVENAKTPTDTTSDDEQAKHNTSSGEINHDILINAWRRFIHYDNASIQLKKDRIQIRTVIIVLGVVTSFLAVSISIINADTVASSFLQGSFRIVLAILPIAVSILIAFATEFAPSTSWAVYRVGAELIRREIYFYRLRVGPYYGVTEAKRHQIFLEHIRKASQLEPIYDTDNLNNPVMVDASQQVLAGNARIPHSRPITTDDQDIVALVKGEKSLPISENFLDRLFKAYEKLQFWNRKGQSTSTQNAPVDDGFMEMTIDNYVEIRLRPQLNWYIKQIQKDYDSLRRWKRRILIWGGLGSVLVAVAVVTTIPFEPLVAVTTAIALAMGLYLELRMYNHTYLIYSVAKQQLHNLHDEWHGILKDLDGDDEDDQAALRGFVMRVEQVLQSEREQWMLRVIQTQTALEQKLAKSEEHASDTKTTSITDAGLATTLVTLGDNAFYQLRQYERAKQLYVESYTIFRRLANRNEQFHLLKKIIMVIVEQSDDTDDQSLAERAAKLYGQFMKTYDGKITWDAVDRTSFDRQIRGLQAKLGVDEFERLKTEGENVSLSSLIPEIMH